MMIKVIFTCFATIFLLGCSGDESSKNSYEKTNTTENKIFQNIEKPLKKYDESFFGGKKVDEYYDMKCASCHGRYGEQRALKASKILNTLSSSEIKLELTMYKNDPNYGGNLKATMHNLAKNLSDDEIEVLSEFIPRL